MFNWLSGLFNVNWEAAAGQAIDYAVKAIEYGFTEYPKTDQGQKELQDVVAALEGNAAFMDAVKGGANVGVANTVSAASKVFASKTQAKGLDPELVAKAKAERGE